MGKMLTNAQGILPRLFAPTAAEMGQGQRFTVTDLRNGAWRTGAALYAGGTRLGTISGTGDTITGDIRSFVREKGSVQLSAACISGALRESEATPFPASALLWAVNADCQNCHIEIDDGIYGTTDGFTTWRVPDSATGVTIYAVPDEGYSMDGGFLMINNVQSTFPDYYSLNVQYYEQDTITIRAAAAERGIRLASTLTGSSIDNYVRFAVQDNNNYVVVYYIFDEGDGIKIYTGRPNETHEAVNVVDPEAGIYLFRLSSPSGWSGTYRFTMGGREYNYQDTPSSRSYAWTGVVVIESIVQIENGS